MDPRLIKPALYAAAALAVSVILWLAWGRFTDSIRAPVVAQLDRVRAELADCAREKEALQAALGLQSAAVDRMAAEARAFAERAAKARLEARLAAEKQFREADQLLAARPLAQDLCQSAELRAHQFIQERRR